MDKEMKTSYIIEKVTRKRYEVTNIIRFMKFSTFHDARKKLHHTPNACFCCNHKFDDNEYIYLGEVTGGNKLFCDDCAKRIAAVLGMDEIKSARFN